MIYTLWWPNWFSLTYHCWLSVGLPLLRNTDSSPGERITCCTHQNDPRETWACILVHRSQLLLWLTNSYFNWNIHKNTNKSLKSTSSPITISHRLSVWQKILNDADGTLWTRPGNNCTFLMFIKWGRDYISGVGCTTVSKGITMVVHSQLWFKSIRFIK